MNDTVESSPQGASAKDPQAPWLLFIHHLPLEPAYLRVKVQRRLKELDARPLKSSVYVRPNTDENLEDLEWLAREVRAEGGTVSICEASFVSGGIDLFDEAPAPTTNWHDLTWVTRHGVKVDRIGTAWLIKRFIDPNAKFKFVPARGYQLGIGEQRFDMYQGEFGHDGDKCTFETMVDVFQLRQRGLRALGEIVHDVDLKDGKFGLAEAAGLKAMIDGIAREHPEDDAARLTAGEPVFDTLYAALK